MHRVLFKQDPVEETEHTEVGPGIGQRTPAAPAIRYRRTICGVPAPLHLPLSFDDDTVVIDDPDVIREIAGNPDPKLRG